jgi:hypothetical protein
MILTYRGNTYKAPTSVQPNADSTIQPKLKLIYRGSTYDYNPRPVAMPDAVTTEGSTVTLIYRGMTYERQLASYKPPQQPSAINWRYKFAVLGFSG